MTLIKKHRNIKTGFFLSLLLNLLFSCDYPLNEEHFVVLDPPDSSIEFDINLMDLPDTLYIFSPIDLNYSFDLSGHEITQGFVKLADKNWNISENQGSITVNPDDFTPGYHILSFDLLINTNTGSIAENLDLENYHFTSQCVAVIDGRPAPVPSCRYYINQDGLLTIEWTPTQQLNFIHYALKKGEEHIIIDDPLQNFYVDSCYIGGRMEVKAAVKVEGEDIPYVYGQALIIEEPLPELNFQNIGFDSLKIWWNKPSTTALFTLSINDGESSNVLLESSEFTGITIPHPGFGANPEYELKTKTLYGSCNYGYICTDNHTLGEPLTAQNSRYAYNHTDQALYVCIENELVVYDINTLEIISSETFPANATTSVLSSRYNSTQTAVLANNEIYIFPDKYLQNPLVIPIEERNYDYVYFTTDNQLVISWPSRLRIINVADQNILAEKELINYPIQNRLTGISTSPDGEYFASATSLGLTIYQNSEFKSEILHSDSRSVSSVLFREDSPGKFYMTLENQPLLELRNASDYSLVNTFELPENSIILNIDTSSGHMLLKNHERVFIFNLNNGRILLSIPCTDTIPQLFNNRLFSFSGYTFNIYDFVP